MSLDLASMTEEQVVQFCYNRILGRDPDCTGRDQYTNALKSGQLTREELVSRFVLSSEFNTRSANCEFVPPGHFYSAIPSQEDRNAFLIGSSVVDPVAGIEMNRQTQLDLLQCFLGYYDERPWDDLRLEGLRYFFMNQSYSYADG